MHVEVALDQGRGPVLIKRATSPEDGRRLQVEASALQAARHPGVVQLVEHTGPAPSDPDGCGELRLRWVGAHSLATTAPLGWAEAASVVALLADTVADLHDRGLAHTRITPDHVVLGSDGTPVLCGLRAATSVERAAPGIDVAGLGRLLADLLGPGDLGTALEPIPERRPWLRRPTWNGYRHRALLLLADQAMAEPASSRPSAQAFAASLRAVTQRRRAGPRPATPSIGPARRPAGRPAGLPVRAPGPGLTGGRDPDEATAGPELAATRPPRRPLATGLAAAAGVAMVLVGVGQLRHAPPTRPEPGGQRPARTTTPRSIVPRRSTPPSSSVTPGRAGIVGAAVPVRTCAPAPEPAADTDGDGCPEAVGIDRGTVTLAGQRYRLGGPADVVLVADWHCDRHATAALLRRASGEVFVFDGWATARQPATATVTDVVPGATGLGRTDRDGDGCPELTVGRTHGPPVVIPIGPGR